VVDPMDSKIWNVSVNCRDGGPIHAALRRAIADEADELRVNRGLDIGCGEDSSSAVSEAVILSGNIAGADLERCVDFRSVEVLAGRLREDGEARPEKLVRDVARRCGDSPSSDGDGRSRFRQLCGEGNGRHGVSESERRIHSQKGDVVLKVGFVELRMDVQGESEAHLQRGRGVIVQLSDSGFAEDAGDGRVEGIEFSEAMGRREHVVSSIDYVRSAVQSKGEVLRVGDDEMAQPRKLALVGAGASDDSRLALGGGERK